MAGLEGEPLEPGVTRGLVCGHHHLYSALRPGNARAAPHGTELL